MVDEKKPDNLEMEKIKLERYKVKGKIIIATITVLFGSGLGTYINYSIQSRQLKQQELVNMSKIKQQEMKYLGDFLDNALVDDYEKRFRFADYFATLTSSLELKKKWVTYREKIVKQKEDFEHTQVLLAKAKEEKNVKKVEELTTKAMQQQAQLEALPDKSDEDMTFQEAQRFLDNRGRPRSYTTNGFELKTIDGDKVVIDHATGLTWQRSGSDYTMQYFQQKSHIILLNHYKYAGYNDWRLPTLEEAITLLEQEKISDGLFIDPVFDKKQVWIWTSDRVNNLSAWVVSFGYGYCGGSNIGYEDGYVRAVR